jgi:hypothetical protein
MLLIPRALSLLKPYSCALPKGRLPLLIAAIVGIIISAQSLSVFAQGCGAGYSGMKTWNAASGSLGHQVGHLEGTDWVATAGVDAAAYIVYGPYDNTFGQGHHFAQFKLLIDNNSGTDTVATLDVITNYGSTVLAQRQVHRNEFSAPNQWQTFTLQFDNPCFGLVEARIYWNGSATTRFQQSVIGAGDVYGASADFSTVQGQRNWYYLDSTGAQMYFNGWAWQGPETYLLLWGVGGHPGNYNDAVRQWQSPGCGSIHITGSVSDANTACGTGVIVSIKKGTQVLWQQTIDNGDMTGFSYDLTTTVGSGEQINFVINNRGDWGCDSH